MDSLEAFFFGSKVFIPLLTIKYNELAKAKERQRLRKHVLTGTRHRIAEGRRQVTPPSGGIISPVSNGH